MKQIYFKTTVGMLMCLVLFGCSSCCVDQYYVHPERAAGSSTIIPQGMRPTFGLLGVEAIEYGGYEEGGGKEYMTKGRQTLWSIIEGKKLRVEEYKYKLFDGTEATACLVYLPSGEMLNELVLAEGYCYVEKNELEDHPDLLERFLKIEKEAKAKKKGGWAYWAKKEAEKKSGN